MLNRNLFSVMRVCFVLISLASLVMLPGWSASAAEGDSLTISGNVGVAGVTVTYTGDSSGTVTSGEYGDYVIIVTQGVNGWSGTVTPSLDGYIFFTPFDETTIPSTSYTYTNIQADQEFQDFTSMSTTITHVIIRGVTGVLDTKLYYTGSDEPLDTYAEDPDGNYTLPVPLGATGWSGTVTPVKEGYTFTPASRTYTNLTADINDQDYIATPVDYPYTISGNAGVGGATISYTISVAKTTTADGEGNYSFTVPANWSGTVTPSLVGYRFTPGSLTYTDVTADQTGQDFTAEAATVTIAGNTGTGGTTLSYTDGTTPITADGAGNYLLTVPYNWTGDVTPSHTGYNFSPAKRSYANLISDQTGQGYTATPKPLTISGNAGIAGASLSYSGGTSPITADSAGNYSIPVFYNWSGTVTPTLDGYVFDPPSRDYTNILVNQTGQNYTVAALVYQVTISGNVGVGGATLDYGDDTVTADDTGNYSFTVSNIWAGTVTPERENYTFTPASRSYANVAANKTGENFDSALISPSMKPALSIRSTRFLAAWSANPSADGYYLDIATDAAFTQFISGYQMRDVGKVTSFDIASLKPGTRYYLRIRAYNTGEPRLSAYSEPRSEMTLWAVFVPVLVR